MQNKTDKTLFFSQRNALMMDDVRVAKPLVT